MTAVYEEVFACLPFLHAFFPSFLSPAPRFVSNRRGLCPEHHDLLSARRRDRSLRCTARCGRARYYNPYQQQQIPGYAVVREDRKVNIANGRGELPSPTSRRRS